jgi:hypothetical protein
MEYKLRKKRTGGGVLIFIKHSLIYSKIQINTTSEVIGIEIKMNLNSNFYLIAYYNPPNSKKYPMKLNDYLINELYNKYKNLMIIGDINAHLTQYGAEKNNKNGNILNKLLDETNLILINDNQKTYHDINTGYEQVLDYVITSPNIANKTHKFAVIRDGLLRSDHFVVKCELHFNNIYRQVSPNINNNKTLYNYDIANWDNFKQQMEIICEQTLEQSTTDLNNCPIDEIDDIINN